MNRTYLSDGDVIRVLKSLMKGENYKSLAREFGVSTVTIYNVAIRARKFGLELPLRKRGTRDWKDIISRV